MRWLYDSISRPLNSIPPEFANQRPIPDSVSVDTVPAAATAADAAAAVYSFAQCWFSMKNDFFFRAYPREKRG